MCFYCFHIHYNGQTDLLDKCLHSIINQTIKPDIYASISFTNNYKQELGQKILKNYSNNVIFSLSKEQMFQMDHLKKLTDNHAYKYDLVMFCDSAKRDDYYHSHRVEMFINAFNHTTTDKIIMGVKEVRNFNKSIDYEYWSYGLEPGILIDFFKRFTENHKLHLLKHIFADMYLRNYLRTVNNGNEDFAFVKMSFDNQDKLYFHNRSNPNSVCATLRNLDIHEIYNNNLFIITIGCFTEADFIKK